ncbi:hypothetical protein BDY19DRAFT_968876 [Irpex rosettiformis]|uniref:Uncharacterized protein n=1 Tax=Irpex rosettiformis TaxID=378272 RepID=A0ACB8TS94_9APHY|nr:hypothetical protein BDY19DRAFT_968876 [Irpex rosettiformis]
MPAEGSTGSSNQPPSYEDLQAERDLKESFAQLLKDHEEIQRLFKFVSAQLDTTPKIGDDHDLSREWHLLTKKHKKLYRDSQLNASQCASFLSNYGTVLVPLSEGSMPVNEKQLMINKFIETIPIHQQAARKTSTRFHELAKQVEVFPIKVASYLRQQAEKGGFWESFWTGVEGLCMSIWNALQKLLNAIISVFHKMLSQVASIRFSCGPFVRIDIEMASEIRPLLDPPSKNSTIQAVKQDAKEIGDKLVGFEDAWHLIHLASSNLLQNVELANTVINVPAAADGHLIAAGVVYQPLVHCLRCYSQGKSPL